MFAEVTTTTSKPEGGRERDVPLERSYCIRLCLYRCLYLSCIYDVLYALLTTLPRLAFLTHLVVLA